MSIDLTLGDWNLQREAARTVRYTVFVVEQKVPLEIEWDDMDEHCLHVVVIDADQKPIATGRLLPDGHIGRMAVLQHARGRNIGSAVLEALIEAARQRGDTAVVLNAQTQAERFYARHGFVREGEEFMEAGIAHVTMRRNLVRASFI
jgi:predicted GNAT family N-acyltransferase